MLIVKLSHEACTASYSAFHQDFSTILKFGAQDAKVPNLKIGTQIEDLSYHMHFEGEMYQRF